MVIYAPCEPQQRRRRPVCALFHVGRRSSIGRPACPRGLRPLQQPRASLLRPRGSIGSADCTVASSFLPPIFRLPSSFWPRSVNRAQCWFGLFGPFFARGALRVVAAPLLASLLLALTHFYSYTLSLSGVGWKKRIALCSSQAASLPSLSLSAHSLLSGNSSGEI